MKGGKKTLLPSVNCNLVEELKYRNKKCIAKQVTFSSAITIPSIRGYKVKKMLTTFKDRQ